jgi:hypothetical protein
MDSHTAKTEHDLLNAAVQIGSIAECPWHYTTGLARLIDASGTPLHELTIGELLALNRQYADRLNRAAEQIMCARFNLCPTTEKGMEQ